MTRTINLQILLLISVTSVAILVNGNTVKSKMGMVNGTILVADNGKTFNAFYGIPYAVPPIGFLRFKPPIEATPWTGIWDGTKEPKICIQIPENKDKVEGDEDCLTLNIYSPIHARPGDNIPVIFYLFGGVFKFGSSLLNGPQHFMVRDIIIVMPNSRLGTLGFMSTGDTVISGNMGLKDQSLALKWVKNYIYEFGGDPNRITLHGHSSGSISAHLHTISPMSQGLYNRAIFQSGTGFCTVAFFDGNVSRSLAQEMARRLKCNATTSYEMYACFLNQKAEVLVTVQEDMTIWRSEPDTIFRPTIEDVKADEPFITTVPIQSQYVSTTQEWMIGVTSSEAAYIAAGFSENGGQLAKELNYKYRELMPLTLQYLWHSKFEVMDFTSDLLKSHYFGDDEIGTNSSTQINNLYSQGLFVSGTNDALRKYNGTKYVYLFDYISALTVYKSYGVYGHFYGVGHADELPLLFLNSDGSGYLSDMDRIFGHEMVKRWTNFAYSGNPNEPFLINDTMFGTWKPSQSANVDYLRLKLNGSMETDFYSDEYEFWKYLPIFSKFY